MAPYTPTLWVNNVAPALSAANLNKLTAELVSQATSQSISNTLPTWADGVAPALTDAVPLNEMERVLASVANVVGLGYTPTVWQAGWIPARNATRLNRMEVQAQANRNAIDGGGGAGPQYYVTTAGNDSTGDGSSSRPWRTLVKACAATPSGQGATINVGPGTFTESATLNVPTKTSIVGAGIDVTTVRTTVGGNMMLAQNTTGPQTLSDVTLEGQNRTTSDFGLVVRNATSFTAARIKAQGFKNTANLSGSAVDIQGTTDFTLSYSTLLNSGNQVTGQAFYNGVLGIGASLRTKIDNCTISSDLSYAIKASGSGTITDLEISNSTLATVLPGNFGISCELWTMTFVNCRIHHCNLDGILSLTGPVSNPSIGNPKTNGGAYRFRLDHNHWDIPAGFQGDRYCVESSSHSMQMDHNYINHGGLYPFSYFESYQLSNDWIHHNVIDQTSNPIAFSHFASGAVGHIYEKNTVILRHAYTTGVFNGLSDSTDQIITNIFYGTVNVGSNLNPGGASVSGNGFFNITAVGSGAVTTNPGLSLASFPAGYNPTNGAYAALGAFADGVFSDVGPQ